MKARLTIGLLAVALTLAPLPAAADDPGTISGDRTTDMIVDVVVVRPLGVVSTLLGTALTVIALPFTVPSGSFDASVQELIVKPAAYTFTRPLGDFSE